MMIEIPKINSHS